VGTRDILHILENRKISCLCLELNPHYTELPQLQSAHKALYFVSAQNAYKLLNVSETAMSPVSQFARHLHMTMLQCFCYFSRDGSLKNGCVALKAPDLEWDTDDCEANKDFICEQTRCYYYNYGSIPVSTSQG